MRDGWTLPCGSRRVDAQPRKRPLQICDGVPEAIRAALLEGEQSGIAEDSSLAGILTELRASRSLSKGRFPTATPGRSKYVE